MENIYPLTLEKEVLRELTATIKGELFRYFFKNNISIDDTNNPVVIQYWKVVKIGNSLIQNVYETMEELNNVAAQLKFIREYVSELK